MVSPFFGDGALALRGWRVLGFDAFQPVVDFWQQVLTDSMRLAEEVAQYHPLTLDGFKRFRPMATDYQPNWSGRRCSMY